MPRVTGPLDTTAPTDTYPTHDSKLGVGGHREVVDLLTRNAISQDRRRQGMLVYTSEDDSIWKLKPGPWAYDDTDWILFAGPQGAYVPPLILDFLEPSFTWTINHNFGPYPSVTLVNEGEVVIGDLLYPSPNVVVAQFELPLTGTAIIRP